MTSTVLSERGTECNFRPQLLRTSACRERECFHSEAGLKIYILQLTHWLTSIQVLHDWSDKYSRKILTLLREVATPSTRLLVLDNIVAYACSDPSVDKDGDGSAVSYREAPSPLLPNFGAANHMGYTIDMAVSPIKHCFSIQQTTINLFALKYVDVNVA